MIGPYTETGVGLIAGMRAASNVEAALRYAEAGIHVFALGPSKGPIANCPRCDFKSGAPRHDMETCDCLTCHMAYAATTDPDRICEMFRRHPNGTLGIRTGAKSGLVVIDAEAKSGHPNHPTGLDVLDQWEQWVEGGWDLPRSVRARTGSGGVHIYLRVPTTGRYPQRLRILPSVDVKADGGYVVAPPSVRLDGGRYELVDDGAPLADASAEFLAFIRNHNPRLSAWGSRRATEIGHVGGTIDRDRYREILANGCPGGVRDIFMNYHAFVMRKTDRPIEDALDDMLTQWRRFAQPPAAEWYCPWEDAEAKVRYVYATVQPDDGANLAALFRPWERNPTDDPGDAPGTPEEATERDRATAPEAPVQFGQHDTGNARRLAHYHGDGVRYVRETDTWYVWDGRRWKRATHADMLEVAEHTVARIYDEAAGIVDGDARRRHGEFAGQSHNTTRLNKLIEAATGLRELSAEADAFDADPYLWNFTNGTVDVRTGRLREHRKTDLITQVFPHPYRPEKTCPRWEALVRRTVLDEDAYEFTQTALGYTLVGNNVEQLIFFLVGEAHTGKSKLVEVVQDVAGPDYAHKSRTSLIEKRRQGHHDSETYSLIGARYVTISEVSTTFDIDETRVKELTGDTKFTTRRLYSPGDRKTPITWTIWLTTNYPPNVQEWDDAIARRIVIIPCGEPIPRHERIPDIDAVIVAEEAEGVLAWLVAGAVRWHAQLERSRTLDGVAKTGLVVPPSVGNATEQYAKEVDHIQHFIDERIEVGEELSVPRGDVLNDFKRWRGRGETTNRNKLYSRIARIPGVTVHRQREFRGIRLRPPDLNMGDLSRWAASQGSD